MKPLVLYGAGKIAEVLLFFFRTNSQREVIACTTEKDFLPNGTWSDLPTVPFESLLKTHPPEKYDLFVALGYQDQNRLRSQICNKARAMGYTLPTYIHPASGVPGDFEYGDNCFIMNNVMIHPKVRIGNNVFIWSGAMVGHHSFIDDNCWLTSCCNISGSVLVGKNTFLAVNSTVGNSVRIGERCFIGANALVTKCTGENEVYLMESNRPHRLSAEQFLRMSKFSDI